ncbi:MAG: HD domain-containing protein, partial [Actinobacteria bacterium]|nr:HD domain-containing protein [Actinomycetota bacterium]
SIAAALLHDAVEDTDLTLDDVDVVFGSDVAGIVDGVTKLDRIQFRHTVDNAGHIQPKHCVDVVESEVGVFDRIVQQRRSDGDLIETGLSDDPSHSEGVVDIRLATRPALRTVCLGGRLVGPNNHVGRRPRMKAPVRFEHRSQSNAGGVVVVATPRQDPVGS